MLFIVLLSSALASTVVLGNLADEVDDDTEHDDVLDPSADNETHTDDILRSTADEESNMIDEFSEGSVIFGGRDDDVLMGFTSDDALHGGGGNDNIGGGDGNDILHGGSGDDTLSGGTGDDTIFGANDVDHSYSQIGNDILYGNAGDDVLTVFEGNNIASGGAGDDFIYGGRGGDILNGGDGDDYLQDTSGSNTIDGGEGNDRINTHHDISINSSSGIVSVSAASAAEVSFDSAIFGNAGNDIMAIGSGVTANGGEGQDTFIFGGTVEFADAPIIEDYQEDEDCIVLLIPEYDASAPPEITVHDSSGDAIISSDGEVVAVIRGAAGNVTADVIQIAATYDFS